METETQEKQDGNDILVSYVGMDTGYNRGKLMVIAGKEDAVEGDIGTLAFPVQAQGVTIPGVESDPVLFSYVYTKGGQSSLRELLVKLNAPAMAPARFSVLVPSASGAWVTQTADVTLVDGNGTVVSFNPHGLAQSGNFLYLVDYETKQILIVDAGALENAADGVTVEVRTFDLTNQAPRNGRGQAVIALKGKLYALYIDTIDEMTFDLSVLIRLDIDGTTGALTYNNVLTEVGRNAQSIIPVTGTANNADVVYLLIPAVGGRQWYGGRTNGEDSNISYVEAEAQTWPTTALIKLTGDPAGTPPTAYDIHAVAAAMRNEDSAIFILTQYYTGGSDDRPLKSPDGAPWRIYRTSVKEFFALPDNIPFIKALDTGALVVVDQGTVTSITSGEPEYFIPFGLYFWDLLYEQVPDTDNDEADRLWAGLGTPILVTSGMYENSAEDPAYGSPTSVFQNTYAMFGFIGGANVNVGAFDLTIETLNQAKRGVSLKRTLRKAQAPKPTDEEIAAAKAKLAAK